MPVGKTARNNVQVHLIPSETVLFRNPSVALPDIERKASTRSRGFMADLITDWGIYPRVI